MSWAHDSFLEATLFPGGNYILFNTRLVMTLPKPCMIWALCSGEQWSYIVNLAFLQRTLVANGWSTVGFSWLCGWVLYLLVNVAGRTPSSCGRSGGRTQVTSLLSLKLCGVSDLLKNPAKLFIKPTCEPPQIWEQPVSIPMGHGWDFPSGWRCSALQCTQASSVQCSA